MAIDLKTATPDTTFPSGGVLFGADSQSAASPSVYSDTAYLNYILGLANTWTATQTISVNGAVSAPGFTGTGTWYTGGSATTTKPYVLFEPAGTTSTGWSTSGTGLGVNAASGFMGSLLDLQSAGAAQFRVNNVGGLSAYSVGCHAGSGINTSWVSIGVNLGLSLAVGSPIEWSGTAGNANAAKDLILTRKAAANLRFGAADAAAPVAQTLSVQSVVAGTSNTAGQNLTITGSQGTGTGAGGSIIFQVAPAGSSGTAQNALATSAQFGPFQGKLYLNSATPTASNYAIWGDATNTWVNAPTSGGYVHFGSLDNWGAAVHPASVRLSSNFTFGWTASNPGAVLDTILTRDAANTLALRNGTNAQRFNIYKTYTDASNYELGGFVWSSSKLTVFTTAAGTGVSKSLELMASSNLFFGSNGGNKWTINTSGHFLADADNTYDIGASGATRPRNVYVGNAITVTNILMANINTLNNTHTVLTFTNSSDNLLFATGGTSPRINFCGTTSSFPALKRSSTTLQVRLADDTANAPLESASLKTDAPAGGTAATWKLGVAASVSPTSPNRTIEVDIGGTIYYISAKTTND